MKKIADAGLLIAFLDRRDKYHRWAEQVFEQESPPFYTAEPILTEVAAVIGTADDVLRMVEAGGLGNWAPVGTRGFLGPRPGTQI